MSEPRAGTEREVRIAMRDGVELAATLFLPDPGSGPQPCLLEALPYRKDDLTASYAETYRRLRDAHGYAVCRLDLRGTGSSAGDATDEYPDAEQADLVEVIAWLAAQPWCSGAVGMWGTSYSGFNALQVACERPPALKAVCAIYASDDRWTDDVHWRGGALRLVDLVDYCHYMTPMNALPPVPALWPAGDDWRQEWLRRVDTAEPWVLTWLRQNRDGAYWRHGSVRQGPAADDGYQRIACPVMIVAGWADGYRNNSFRTVEALAAAGVPHRLLAGPWGHADPATAMPGPRIDLDREMVAWWDRWLRADATEDHRDVVDVFVRRSTRPAPDLDLHPGRWTRTPWPPADRRLDERALTAPRSLDVEPDVGTAAWIDCAGHLPWGLSDDQRLDDARSLTWDLEPPTGAVLGSPRLRLRISASAPAASVSVKLCDVFPDGASALVSRGTLDLAFRDGLHAPAVPRALVPGEEVEVTVDLDACAYAFDPGQVLRVSLAGSDWPNTVSPPAPVRLTVHEAVLLLPLVDRLPDEVPDLLPGAPHAAEDPTGVTWSVERDVLRRTTTCRTGSRSTYAVPHGGTATEEYAGQVGVDRRTFEQWADAEAVFELVWPETGVRVRSTMRVDVHAELLDVAITLAAEEGPAGARSVVRTREWREQIPR